MDISSSSDEDGTTMVNKKTSYKVAAKVSLFYSFRGHLIYFWI